MTRDDFTTFIEELGYAPSRIRVGAGHYAEFVRAWIGARAYAPPTFATGTYFTIYPMQREVRVEFDRTLAPAAFECDFPVVAP